MSYQVLARKWRPKDFSSMVGQSHVLKALIHALDEQKLHHAYLFTGTRGVGKTTVARIFAKCLNCEQGVSSKPCGQCSSCTSIADGTFSDLIEVDAASRTKVEDTRDLLDNVQFFPTVGRYKIYLIDEVHMLSNHSFNALLKTLEEPPEHVKFLLATTDAHKLPITVLSRCLQFSLRNLSPEQISEHLNFVLSQEKVAFETPALNRLAQAADGSVRDALSLLDQAIAFGHGEVKLCDVVDMLGGIDDGYLYQLLESLADNDAEAIWETLNTVAQLAPDYQILLDEFATLLYYISQRQVVKTDKTLTEDDRIQQLALTLNVEDVQLFYQIALHGKEEIMLAPSPKLGFEMTILRMYALRPSFEDEVVESVQNTTLKSTHTPTKAPAVKKTLPIEKTDAKAQEKKAPHGFNLETLKQQWPDIHSQLSLGGVSKMLIDNAIVHDFDGRQLTLGVSAKYQSMASNGVLQKISQAIAKHVNFDIKVITKAVDENDDSQKTPAAIKAQKTVELKQAAVENFKADPHVQKMMEVFGAKVEEDNVTVKEN